MQASLLHTLLTCALPGAAWQGDAISAASSIAAAKEFGRQHTADIGVNPFLLGLRACLDHQLGRPVCTHYYDALA